MDSQKSILLDCETQVESLLSATFQNYKSLDEKSPTGLVDISGPILETAAPALAPAVQVYTLLHDILAQDSQTMLRKYLQVYFTKLEIYLALLHILYIFGTKVRWQFF